MVNGRQKHEVLRTQEATTPHRQIVDEFEAKEGQSLFIINVHLNPCVQAPKVVQRIDRSLEMLPHPLFKVERCLSSSMAIGLHRSNQQFVSQDVPAKLPGRKDGCNSVCRFPRARCSISPLQRVRCCGLVHVTRENKSATETLVCICKAKAYFPNTRKRLWQHFLNKDDALSPRLH